MKASKPEHFLAAIHQATVEAITLQQAGKDLNLSTLATNWYPEIQELIARTKVEVSPGKAQPMLTYPTENTKGTIIGWFLKRQRQELQKQAGSVSADADGIDDVSKTSEAELKESDMLDANETMSTTANAAEDQFNHAADLEEAAVVEDEKLAGRQGGEFETQHHPDQHSPGPTRLGFFYEGVEAPALDADQSYLDMKLNFKDELTYFVSIPFLLNLLYALNFDLVISPYHAIDRTSRPGSCPGPGQDTSLNLHLSAGSYKAETQELGRDACYEK